MKITVINTGSTPHREVSDRELVDSTVNSLAENQYLFEYGGLMYSIHKVKVYDQQKIIFIKGEINA